MIEHCVSVFLENRRSDIYEVYISDALKYINESIANRYGGAFMKDRFIDLLEPAEKEEQSADEIALDVIRRAGLKTR